MENEIIENGTEILIFKYVPEKKINQDYEHFIRGKIIESEILSEVSYNTYPWYVPRYTLLGEDGIIYYGSYKYPSFGDSFFMTEEDYVLFLKNKVSLNNEKISRLEDANERYVDILSSLENDKKTRLVPEFSSKAQEELFSRCSKESMFEMKRENKNKVRRR